MADVPAGGAGESHSPVSPFLEEVRLEGSFVGVLSLFYSLGQGFSALNGHINDLGSH